MSAEGATHGDWDAPAAWADGDWADGTGPAEGGEARLGDGAGLRDGEEMEGEMLEAALEAALEEASGPLHAASLRARERRVWTLRLAGGLARLLGVV